MSYVKLACLVTLRQLRIRDIGRSATNGTADFVKGEASEQRLECSVEFGTINAVSHPIQRTRSSTG